MPDSDPSWVLWIARLAIYLTFLYLAFQSGRLRAQREIRLQLPSHVHRAVDGCDRCRMDHMLNL